MLQWLNSFLNNSKAGQSNGTRVGYYGVVKRNLDVGGPENLSIPFDLPVDWERVAEYAIEMDKMELLGNPNSSYRYFPTQLTADEVDEHLRIKALFAKEAVKSNANSSV